MDVEQNLIAAYLAHPRPHEQMWPQCADCAGVLKNDSPTVDVLQSPKLTTFTLLLQEYFQLVMLHGGDGPGPLLTAAHANGWKMEDTDRNNCLS